MVKLASKFVVVGKIKAANEDLTTLEYANLTLGKYINKIFCAFKFR